MSRRGGPGKANEVKMSKSMGSLDIPRTAESGTGALTRTNNPLMMTATQINTMLNKAQSLYNSGSYSDALIQCEKVYESDAYRTDNLLLLGAIQFQLRNFSESIFYNQQCIRVDENFAEAYSNLGNALKELGDLKGATDFYMKVSCVYFNSIACCHSAVYSCMTT